MARRVSSPHFVGRAVEVQTLDELLAQAMVAALRRLVALLDADALEAGAIAHRLGITSATNGEGGIRTRDGG